MENQLQKPSPGQTISINIETKTGGQIRYQYVVQRSSESFLEVAKYLSGKKNLCVSNVMDSNGKRVKGANPPFMCSGVYTFPCVEI